MDIRDSVVHGEPTQFVTDQWYAAVRFRLSRFFAQTVCQVVITLFSVSPDSGGWQREACFKAWYARSSALAWSQAGAHSVQTHWPCASPLGAVPRQWHTVTLSHCVHFRTSRYSESGLGWLAILKPPSKTILKECHIDVRNFNLITLHPLSILIYKTNVWDINRLCVYAFWCWLF